MSAITNKELLRYAGPAALSSIGGVVVGLTDTVIIGHYSTDALAGVGPGASLYELPVNALLGALMAYRILAPRIAGTDRDARDVAGLTVVLRGLAKWLALAFMVVFVAGIVLDVLGNAQQDEPMHAAGLYLVGRSFSIIPEVVTAAMVVTLVSWGRVKTPFVVFFVTSGVNLAFGYLLVYGIGPFPRLGPLGDGIASSLGAAAVLYPLITAIRREHQNAPTKLSSDAVAEHFADWRQLTLPAVGSATLDYAGNIVFTMVIALGGAGGLAAARVANTMHLLAFVVVSSLSSAALYLVGRDAVNVVGDATARASLRRRFIEGGVAIGVVFALLASPVSVVASADPHVRNLSVALIVVVAAMCPIISWAYANVALLRAMKRTGSDFLSNSLAVWCAQIPVAIIGALTFHVPGTFVGLAAYWLCRALVSARQVTRAVRESGPDGQLAP